MRVKGLQEDDADEDESVCMYLKNFLDQILNEMALKGIPEISKVTFSQYDEMVYDEQTGASKKIQKNWLIETDGVALQKILGFGKIDYRKTTSNDIQEILRVLGIEAVRNSLISELRFVLGSYGIYVNYRHLSTLCDVMTQRGILTSITRHGINRVDTGPLRKCSFEETVEILYEAAVFAETDHLSGITENIIMGQLAPYGTGSFDLVIDNQIMQEFAQSKPDDLMNDEYVGGETPIQNDPYALIGTPIAMNTPQPHYGGIGSEHSMAGTPAYIGGMSPANPYQSPGYHMSPNYAVGGGQSPAYRPQQSPCYQSPIYQTNAGGGPSSSLGMMSPAHNASQMSPSYSPTNSRMSPSYGQHLSPAYVTVSGGAITQSPAYYGSAKPYSSGSSFINPTSSISGTYNPNASPSYSPTNYSKTILPLKTIFLDQASPRYSPTTPNYSRQVGSSGPAYSPQYSPTAQVYGAGAASVTSSRYGQSAASPNRFGTAGGGASSSHQPGSSPGASGMYIPSSPCYNPSSSPGASVTMGPPTTMRPAYTPASPMDESSSDFDGNTPDPTKKE